MVPKRLLPVNCETCRAELTLIVNHEGEIPMMQVWTCVVCRASNEALSTRSIKQVTRRIDRQRRCRSLDR